MASRFCESEILVSAGSRIRSSDAEFQIPNLSYLPSCRTPLLNPLEDTPGDFTRTYKFGIKSASLSCRLALLILSKAAPGAIRIRRRSSNSVEFQSLLWAPLWISNCEIVNRAILGEKSEIGPFFRLAGRLDFCKLNAALPDCSPSEPLSLSDRLSMRWTMVRSFPGFQIVRDSREANANTKVAIKLWFLLGRALKADLSRLAVRMACN